MKAMPMSHTPAPRKCPVCGLEITYLCDASYVGGCGYIQHWYCETCDKYTEAQQSEIDALPEWVYEADSRSEQFANILAHWGYCRGDFAEFTDVVNAGFTLRQALDNLADARQWAGYIAERQESYLASVGVL